MQKLSLNALIVIVLLVAGNVGVLEARQCHQCSGINCQRTSYAQSEDCEDQLDVCVSVFDGETLEAQGCLGSISDALRVKCSTELDSWLQAECTICEGDLCNNQGPNNYRCIQCDSNVNPICSTDATQLSATACPISKSSNLYCYAKDIEGRTVRGCTEATSVQVDCLNDPNCLLCSPTENADCNSVKINGNSDNNSTTTTTTAQPSPTPTVSGSSSSSTPSQGTSTEISTSPTTDRPPTQQPDNPSSPPTTSPPSTDKPDSAANIAITKSIFFLLVILHFVQFISH